MSDDRPDPLRLKLDHLARSEAGGFDPVGLRFARGLLDRADRHGGGAGAHLRARAAAHLEQLARRLADERRACTGQAAELAQRGFDPRAAEAAIDRGDLVAVRRAARRVRDRPARATGPARRLDLIPSAPPDGKQRRRAGRAPAAASALEAYRAPLAELVTQLSLARSRRTVPAPAGPYNGRMVAAHLLEVLATLSPSYAHTQLERMNELAALTLLPEPPAPRKRPRQR